MKSRREWVVAGAATLLSAGCSSSALLGRPALPAIVEVPGARRSDWHTAPPDSQGMDAAALAAVLQSGAELRALRSLLVVRHGVLVAERYYAGASAADVLPVNSIAKSVSAMLVGQALQRGSLPGLAAPLSRLLQ